jgi:ABC-type branched-subunit amino acid transport system substrate-binding protein
MNRRGKLLVPVAALVTVLPLAGCAGEVGKYRNASLGQQGSVNGAVAPGVVLPGAPTPAGSATTAAGAPGAVSGPVVGGVPTARAGGAPVMSGPATGPVAAGAPNSIGSMTGVTKSSITIGVLYAQTGAYAAVSQHILSATQAAFDDLGPIYGRRVVVKGYDDGTSDAATIQASEKSAQSQVFALTSIVSESNVVLAPLANRDHVPVVVGNIDEKVAEPLRYAFAVSPYWAKQAEILPGFIKDVLKAGSEKIGVVYETTSTATDAKNIFKQRAAASGLNVVFEQPIAQNQSTCINEVSNLQAHGAQVVFMMNGPLGAICMMRDARAVGYHPTWTGLGTSWNFSVVAQASGGSCQDIRTLGSSTTLDTTAGRHYAAVMQARGDRSAASDDIALIGWDLARTIAKGLQATGPQLGRDAFVRAMESKVNGYDSGYLPPPVFGPGIRTGPVSVSNELCNGSAFTTPQPGWHTSF